MADNYKDFTGDGPIELTSTQQQVIEILNTTKSQRYSLGDWYIGAIYAAKNPYNPDRFSQAAQSLRELLEKLPRVFIESEISESSPDFRGMRNSLYTRLCSGKKRYDGKWKGKNIDGQLDKTIRNVDRYLELNQLPTRKEQINSVIDKLDPMHDALDLGIRLEKTERFHTLWKTFEGLAHHNSKADEKIFKSGFHVYIGERIEASDKTGIGNLARYIIRACFSQERMVYVPADKSNDGIAKVVYTSKDKKSRQVFDALEWLARLVTHIPGRYEQTVRYYGYYSNKSRGMRKKCQTDDTVSAVIQDDVSPNQFRKNWARLIQKIYEVDPLVCANCQGTMRIISFIERPDIIKKILRHLGLWDLRNHDPPQTIPDYILELIGAEAGSQLPIRDPW